MKSIFTGCFFLLFILPAFALHNGSIRGSVFDVSSKSPLPGASVLLSGAVNARTYTDELGFYQFSGLPAGVYTITINYLGFKSVTEQAEVRDSETSTIKSFLTPAPIELKNVEISADPDISRQTIPALDINLRPVNTSQDVLRMVPGLFIAQHAGGGKAEQIFLRGFDIDHGTDIALDVDGIPVNMVSHAHGQGYADLHFLIPETVERVQFAKGPYYAPRGNLATAGYVGFQTKNALDKNLLKVSAGQFNSFRTVGAFKLLDKPEAARPQNAYIATEYFYSDGYFDSPQAYNRFSTFLKYNAAIGNNTYLNASLGAFTSRWDASGQIPDRAVQSGQIGRFGAIDDTEGGSTSRGNLNFRLATALPDGALLKNQLYFSRYNFELYSNFTFFLNDPVNGDQIRQKEQRNLLGYNGAYTRADKWNGTEWQTEVGVNFRYDAIKDNELSHTKGRQELLERRALGDVNEYNLGIYLDEKIKLGSRFILNPGLRFDQFQFLYVDKLQASYDRKIVASSLVSPKLNLYYTWNERLQLFANSGYGFHSNDTRVVTAQNGRETLPRALGFEAGATVKVLPRLLFTFGAWRLHLDQEFVYVGDEAVVEPSGKTTRQGLDFAARWQLAPWLFADADLNYTLARADDTPEGENYIPLAAAWTSIGGLSFNCKNGINGSLRYRYLGDRPANEDNSVVAQGYFLTDIVLNYTRSRFEIGVAIQNLFNRAWNEAQFDTESRLFDELEPVSEIHFTPGTPFSLMGHASIFF
ncbi:MAG: TonB-dependent receptor [Thermoanaerobaculia bacterium]|nr:TonB-dependent receptor [Thermoanaerobaculia bacterium]